MKITEYPTAQFFDENDVLIKDGTNGTKQIKASDMVYALFDPIPEMHKEIFRGKSLGATFTTAQKEAIENGSFHDLWLGDYWESGDTKYRIVDFNYYNKYFFAARPQEATTMPNHLVVMPDGPIVEDTVKINSALTSTSYANWSFRTSSEFGTTTSTIISFFGSDNFVTFYDYYPAAVEWASNGTIPYVDVRHNLEMKIELPSVEMMLGSNFTAAPASAYSNTKPQFSLMSKCPEYINAVTGDFPFATRTIAWSLWSKSADAMYICTIGSAGGNYIQASTDLLYIRPYFCVKG